MKGHKMSVQALRWAWGAQVTPTCKLVLIALADRADDDGVCWPSVEDITMRTGLSERTVRRELTALASLGIIVRDQRAGRSNVFRMSFGAVENGENAAEEPAEMTAGGATLAPRGVPHWQGGGATLAPITINRTLNIEPTGTVLGAHSPKRGENVARGTRLPGDWWPSPDGVDFAERLGLDVSVVCATFSDYWRSVPGSRGCKSDWLATWRNWCRREAERQSRNRPRSSQWSAADQDAEVRRIVAQHSQPQLRVVK